MKLILILLFIAPVCLGQDGVESKSSKKSWMGALSYSYYDLWIFSKVGAIVSYGTKERVYELAYQTGTFNFDVVIADLGEVTEERLHLTTRSFSYGNSFNYQYGLSINTLAARLGRDWYGDAGPRYDAISVKTLGLLWGIGNRWSWENGINLGFDWIKFFYPITIIEKDTAILDVIDKEDREDLEKFVDFASQIPTVAILHFEIGYRF